MLLCWTIWSKPRHKFRAVYWWEVGKPKDYCLVSNRQLICLVVISLSFHNDWWQKEEFYFIFGICRGQGEKECLEGNRENQSLRWMQSSFRVHWTEHKHTQTLRNSQSMWTLCTLCVCARERLYVCISLRVQRKNFQKRKAIKKTTLMKKQYNFMSCCLFVGIFPCS